MTKVLEFQTRRLELRQWQQNDRSPFAALNADPQVMEFFPATLDRIQSDAMAEKISAKKIKTSCLHKRKLFIIQVFFLH